MTHRPPSALALSLALSLAATTLAAPAALATGGGAGPVGGQRNVQMHFTMEIE